MSMSLVRRRSLSALRTITPRGLNSSMNALFDRIPWLDAALHLHGHLAATKREVYLPQSAAKAE